MNLLLEEKVCTNCLLPRPLPSFVGDGHAFVLLDICSYCRDTLSHLDQKISFNKCRAKRIVLRNNWRARQLALPADLTVEQWIEVLEQSNGYCYHCHTFIGEQALVLDHLIPLALGGGTTLSNVVPTCQRCNADKRGRTVEQWRQGEARQELDRMQKRRGKPEA
jgi:5-methylcytosine-specific restriction endonuclease McrA